MNILKNNEFLGFMDPKIDRVGRIFIIKDVVLKRELENDEWDRVLGRIEEFARFHNAKAIQVIKTESAKIQRTLLRHGFSESKKGGLLLNFN